MRVFEKVADFVHIPFKPFDNITMIRFFQVSEFGLGNIQFAFLKFGLRNKFEARGG